MTLRLLLLLQVAVLYCSDYGYSDRLSQTLAKGITKTNVKTEMVDALSVDPQVCAVGLKYLMLQQSRCDIGVEHLQCTARSARTTWHSMNRNPFAPFF